MSKILFVHPDEKVIAVMDSVLSKAGHEVLAASGGASALKMFKEHAPDIVVLNHELPRLRPFETFAAIRKADPHAKVLVFALAGESGGQGAPAKFGITTLRPGELLDAVGRLLEPAGNAHPSARLLVVDDDPGVRATLSRFLQEKGYEVAEAGDGLEATALHESFRPRLILLDIDMPRLTGVETLKRIRGKDEEVGVMMITGNDAFETMEQCRDLGAFDYVLKPFDFGYLEFSVYAKVLAAGEKEHG